MSLLEDECYRYDNIRQVIVANIQQLTFEMKYNVSEEMKNLLECLDEGRVPGTKSTDV